MTWRRPVPCTRELSLAVSLLALLVTGVAPVAWLVVSTLADAALSELRALLLTGRQWHLPGNTLLLGGLVGEVAGESTKGGLPNNSTLLGVIWQAAAAHVFLDAGVRRGISHGAPNWQFTAGMTVGVSLPSLLGTVWRWG